MKRKEEWYRVRYVDIQRAGGEAILKKHSNSLALALAAAYNDNYKVSDFEE
jgi:hypothetical protein